MDMVTDFLIKAGIPVILSLLTTIIIAKYRLAVLEKGTDRIGKDIDGLGSRLNTHDVLIAKMEERLSDCTSDTDGIYSKLNKNTQGLTQVKTAIEYLKNGKSKSM